MKKKSKRKPPRRVQPQGPTVIELDKQKRILVMEGEPLPKRKVLELFTASVRGDGQYTCLIKALVDSSPHQFGHLLGDVLHTHAEVYAKSFGLDGLEAAAQIFEGLIHEIADTLRKVQDVRFEKDRVAGEMDDRFFRGSTKPKVH